MKKEEANQLIKELIEIRTELIKKHTKCRDYKSNKNAIMREIEYVAVLETTIKSLDKALQGHVNFS